MHIKNSVKLKVIAACLASMVSSSGFTKNLNCTFSWDVKAENIPVGELVDVLTKKGSTVEVVSVFSATPALAFLGITKVRRRMVMNEDKNSFLKSEIRNASVRDETTWQLTRGILSKTVGDVKIEEMPYGLIKTIDSTVFPYLPLVGYFDKKNQGPTPVISANGPYTAQVSVEYEGVNKVNFVATNKSGEVIFDDERVPLSYEFTENNRTTRARLKTRQCS